MESVTNPRHVFFSKAVPMHPTKPPSISTPAAATSMAAGQASTFPILP